MSDSNLPSRPDARASAMTLGRTEFVVMMAMLMALQALACDAMLPAIGTAGEIGVGHGTPVPRPVHVAMQNDRPTIGGDADPIIIQPRTDDQIYERDA